LYATALVAGAIVLDPITIRVIRPPTPAPRFLSHGVLASPGNGTLYLPLAAALWWHGRAEGDAARAAVGVGLASSVIWTRLMVQLPKIVFQRERPNEAGSNAFTFEGPLGGNANDALPSGHAATAFAAAAYLREVKLFNENWSGQVATALAFVTAAQRVYSGEHWLGDVLAGALIGQVCGRFMARRTMGWRVAAGPTGARVSIPIGGSHSLFHSNSQSRPSAFTRSPSERLPFPNHYSRE
jgi:undecaprenyl-diphosphatase